jgi:hypothetical protein
VTGPSEEQARRRIQSLLFGMSDMACVEATAEHLMETEQLLAVGREALLNRTLEAGLVVIYARPFTASRGLPPLKPAPFQTEHMRGVHQAYLDQRDSVYAHTDDTGYRIILEFDFPDWIERFVEEGPTFRETWSPPTPDLLEDVRALAVANRASFGDELERLRQRLSAGESSDE